jgi:hypothetical protein
VNRRAERWLPDGAEVRDAGRSFRLVTEILEEGLSERYGTQVRVHALRAEASSKSTSFAVHRLQAMLRSGDVLTVVLKDLNPLHQLPDARRRRALELAGSRRELWMYSSVLSRLELGTPAVYGFRWDPPGGALWLLLEDVGPRRLCGRLDLAASARTVAWLARFHLTTRKMDADGRLLRFDREHYEALGRRLEACLDRVPAEDRAAAERILSRYGELLRAVDAAPRGLMHGELFGKNVVLRPDTESVAVIDWETAGIGPQYADLASLLAGHWSKDERMTLRRAYFEAMQEMGEAGAASDWERFNHEVDDVATLQSVGWLGYWASYPEEPKHAKRVRSWVRELRACLGEGGP